MFINVDCYHCDQCCIPFLFLFALFELVCCAVAFKQSKSAHCMFLFMYSGIVGFGHEDEFVRHLDTIPCVYHTQTLSS